MATKLLITLRTTEEAQVVRNTNSDVLAEYPDSILVRADDAQLALLQAANLEITPLAESPVQVTGLSFTLEQARAANDATPIVPEPNRTAYYLIQLVGPIKAEWLNTLRALGATMQGNLPGYTLLVGLLPARVAEVEAQPWVEAVSIYRPAMKVSPMLRTDVTRSPGIAGLESLEPVAVAPTDGGQPAAAAPAPEQVEIALFQNESAAAIAGQIRAAGGIVISENRDKVIALVAPTIINELANVQSVQAIVPHQFPVFHNDRARDVMAIPLNHTFGSVTVQGDGQIVAVADSGLDTGNAAMIHADFAGRVNGLVSLPVRPELNGLINNPPGADDGPQDANSGHGTHVAGSVLGNGAAATAAGAGSIPRGSAPQARLYFQAIEQQVNWKTVAQLIAEGVPPASIPPTWPPPAISLWGLPDNLSDLFAPAYAAGARIHTNSWGAPAAGQYDDSSREVDQYAWMNRDALVIFSAGNSGVDVDSNGVIDADSIGSPGTAKNCLTVGATENNRPSGSVPTPGVNGNWSSDPRWTNLVAAGHVSDDVDGMAAFSSRGPTDDGRIKPEVVAPGTNVLSVRSSLAGPDPLWGDVTPAGDPLNGIYCWSGGTSMSTPLVAGVAALIRQHLVQQRGHVQNGVKPSGALLKAFIINGAALMPGQFAGEIPAGVNNVSGFGRVHVAQSLAPGALAQTLFADEPDYAVETMQTRTFEIKAVDLAQPLKMTLVWTDAPAPVNIGGLQNQLYLQVVQPDSTVIDGDLTPFPTATNNVQQITINAPQVGTYQIRVRGISVTQQSPGAAAPLMPGLNPRQDFALAVSNGMGFSTQPVSIAQAIDTTGSMATFGYMEPAKERAHQLVDFMRINDKVSITEFSERAGEPNDARTPYPLRLLGNFTPDWTQAHSAIAGFHGQGRTPIGAGLQEAWNQLSAEPTSRPRAIVLLSDGFNNEPPDPAAVLPLIPNDVPIFSIALGPASNTAALQTIANSRPNGAYFAVEADEDIHKLHAIYAQLQGLAAGAALVGLAAAEIDSQAENQHEMDVEPHAKELTFTLSWEQKRALEKMELIVIAPDGKPHDHGAPGTMARVGGSHHLVRIAAPQAGPWRLLVRNHGSEERVRYTLSGAVQSPLNLSAHMTKVSADHLLMTAQLHYGAKPWDDARVVARLTMPTRSHKEILAEFGGRIREIQLPETLMEKGLSDEQIQYMKLALFAQEFRQKEGGLYGRETVEIELSPQGDGMWAAEAPIFAPGNVTVDVLAKGEIDGAAWQRVATQSAQTPQDTQSTRRFQIGDMIVRHNRLWPYTIVGVRVHKADGAAATPRDGVVVTARLTQRNQQADSGAMPYYARGRYFIWRFKDADFVSGPALLSAEVRVDNRVVSTANKKIRI